MVKILVRNALGGEKIYPTEGSDPELIALEIHRWWALPGVTNVKLIPDEE